MQIKVFKAETMKDAMAAMKAELGEDAVILHSRKYKQGGFFGFGGKEIIEITAAVEAVPLAERVRGIYKKPPNPTQIIDGEGEQVLTTFNDELPIERPDISDESERKTQTENERLAETIRNAQNPPPEEILQEDENNLPSEDELPGDENNLPVEDELPGDENNLPSEDELPVDDNNLPVDENNLPIEDELHVDENNLPVEDELPVDENNLPTDDELPVDDNNLPVDENNLPIEDELHVDENNLPVEDELPVDENNLPTDDELPVDDNNLPVEDELPVDENNLPVEDELPVDDNNLPTENDLPVDENFITDENLPIDEQTQQGFGFTPDQLAQAQAMMFAQFNQYQMAMAQMQMQAQAQAQAEVAEMAEQMRELHRRRLSTAGKSETIKVARMTPEEKKIHQLENEVARMKNILSGVVGRNTAPNSVTLREALTYQEVDDEILDEMDADAGIGDTSADVLSSAARLTLSNYLEEHLKFSGGIKLNRHGARIVAVLGTTGVGKTTTLAKIAAKFMLDHKINAVLITADTYRISAIDQLKTYSDILGLPLEIVYSPAELSAAIDKHKNRDLILIDTAGRSRQSFQQMQELKDLLSVHSRIEKHLVISATTKITDARDMMEKFSIVEPEKIIITKIDETGSLGLILNLLKDSNLMLSYLTTGQGVPEDIELANVNTLTDMILKKIVGEQV